MPKSSHTVNVASVPLTAILAWVLPGLGHWWVGERVRGGIFFVVLTVTFWAGVAIGGVRSTVTLPVENGAWFYAQLCMGPQSLGGLYLSQSQINQARERGRDTMKAIWPASNTAVVYSGVAGLLNLLVIIDAMARADARRREGRHSAFAQTTTRKGR